MPSSFTNKSRNSKNSQSENTARAVLELADENEAIARRIREIEDFISAAPLPTARIRHDGLQTIPPPEGHKQPLHLHPVTGLVNDRPLSRRQAAVQIANRRKNMVVFIASAILFTIFAYWLSHSL